MSLQPIEQATQIIQRSSNILLCIPQIPKIDSLVSVLAAKTFLEAYGKKVNILAQNIAWPDKLFYLEPPETISSLQSDYFVISLDISKTRAKEVRYEIQENYLNLLITPETGNFSMRDVKFPQNTAAYDLIIILGVSDLDQLGTIYEECASLFCQTPILNIDHSVENENFGKIQLIDINAFSTSEILFSLFQCLKPEIITPEIATMLLTGIIAQTHCYRLHNTTHSSLKKSAELIKLNADREKIVSHLYRNRTISVLQLWGKILSRLKHDQKNQMVYSLVYEQDFFETKTTPENMFDIVDEIIINIPDIKIVVLFFEGKNKTIQGFITITNQHISPKKLLPEGMGIKESKRFAYFYPKGENIKTVSEEIVKTIRENYEKLSGI